MDIQPQNRPHLEPIQEESECEDETEASKTRDGNEDDFPFQVGVEKEDALAEDESDKDDSAAQLRVLRPGRLSHSISQLPNNRRSSSGKLRVKVSKIKWQKQTRPKQPVQKPRKSSKKGSLAEEPFPQWLVDLMVSIEEATTHQLVVE